MSNYFFKNNEGEDVGFNANNLHDLLQSKKQKHKEYTEEEKQEIISRHAEQGIDVRVEYDGQRNLIVHGYED